MRLPEKVYVVIRCWYQDGDGYEIVGPAYTAIESAKAAKEQLQRDDRNTMYAIKAIDLVTFSFNTKLRG